MDEFGPVMKEAAEVKSFIDDTMMSNEWIESLRGSTENAVTSIHWMSEIVNIFHQYITYENK
jgi:hypothetical protein